MNERQIEQYRDDQLNHLENTQPDLEYQISLIDDELAQIFTQNYSPHNNLKRRKTGLLLVQAIEKKLRDEAEYKTAQWLEENE